ncbi:MAG: molybdopterin-dependent oxidoreductase, partial [Alphaproteobacteria bacterium]|nr:molybdopterin-dependent oxidoreductase [Alphaproteobacteria bacterium]
RPPPTAAAPVHPQLGGNLCYATAMRAGDPETALAEAAHVVEGRFSFARHTGVPVEPRVVIADYDPGEGRLTVHGSHQAPWHQQDTLSRHLGIPEHLIRVVTPDIGGGFGIKLHIYGEEIAVSAVSKMLGRPVKYAADRMESFVSDIQARDQAVDARMGVGEDGRILGLSVNALASLGAYASYGRTPINEGLMTITMAGGPYANEHYEGRLRVAFQNKPPSGMYRAVGQPIACAVTEQLLDRAAHAAGIDPVEMRRRNYWAEDAYPLRTPGGIAIRRLSLRQCLDKLVAMMGYDALRAEQAALRRNGVYRGIGVATFLEMTAIGAERYGPAGARIGTQDGATVRLEPSGRVRCVTSVIEIGQGTLSALAQIVADRLGIAPEDVGVVGGDTALTPYGGGAWASRGLTIGGEAVWRAAEGLRENILGLAGAILQADPADLCLAGGAVCDRATGEARLALAEIGRIGHFRQDTLPPGVQPELAVTRHYVPDAVPFALANGVQGSWLEVDAETGEVRLLGHWVVEDCGRIVNPLLVEEQIRGGVVQGIGGALFEECRYDEQGQLLNGTLADYPVPTAAGLPDIRVGHVETPLEGTALGAKGAGEAGTVGAPAAVLLAVNDALRPLGAEVSSLPITPQSVLRAIAAVS